MNIFVEITGIKYKLYFSSELTEISFDELNVNSMPSSCIIKDNKHNFCISKWVSPKRTRSYPYERVYNTLSNQKRITVIPIIKDEGSKGDRDYIQWDTISLMSLLDVYVILAYYEEADKHPTRGNKITNQKFNNDYVKNKITEIGNYHSSPLHWNLQEIAETLPLLIDLVKKSYQKISDELNVTFHNFRGIDKFKNQFLTGVEEFMKTSREKAKEAQNREQQTIQPKEALSTLTKATITIKNYLGGLYYFTTDEIDFKDKNILLIEAKHSKSSKLPSIGDIKDGLLKLILYCNLKNVTMNDLSYCSIPVLKLTSSKLEGNITSDSEKSLIEDFFINNKLSAKQIHSITILFQECAENNFLVMIGEGNNE
jgi:hypothetical protein